MAKKIKLKADNYGNPPQTVIINDANYSWIGSSATRDDAKEQALRFKRKWSNARTRITRFKDARKLKWVVYATREQKRRRR